MCGRFMGFSSICQLSVVATAIPFLFKFTNLADITLLLVSNHVLADFPQILYHLLKTFNISYENVQGQTSFFRYIFFKWV